MPSYFSGYSYGSNFGGNIYGGNSFGNTTAWNETYKYPTFDTYFTCKNEVFIAGVDLKNISGDDIKEFTKDKLGGLQIIKVHETSPNQDIFQTGDIILKINEKRVLEVTELGKLIDGYSNKDAIPASIIREGKIQKLKFKAVNVTDSIEQNNIQVIKSICPIPEVKSRPICKNKS